MMAAFVHSGWSTWRRGWSSLCYIIHIMCACMHVSIFSFSALFKGFVPKVMRLAPGGAIMFIVYDAMYDLLKRKFS